MRRLLFVAALGAACSASPAPGLEPAPREPSAPTPAPGDAVAAGFVGVVVAPEVVDVAPTAPGVIARLLVRAGDRVLAGQLVAELDPRLAQDEVRAAEAALDETEAELARARIDLAGARRDLAREELSVRDGVSPPVSAEDAALAVRRAEAATLRATSSVAAKRARLAGARNTVDATRLVAPFAGEVALRLRDPGATVARGEPLVRLLRDGPVVLRFAVPPERARGLRPGAAVRATVDSVPAPLDARIARVAPALDPASGLVLVEADVLTRDRELRPGLAATVTAP